MIPEARRTAYLYETGRSEKRPLLPRHLPRRKTQRELLGKPARNPLEIADMDGYNRGRHNWQTTTENFATGEEWIAWYRGWKRGQAERPKWESIL
jgi:hypothetical protein